MWGIGGRHWSCSLYSMYVPPERNRRIIRKRIFTARLRRGAPIIREPADLARPYDGVVEALQTLHHGVSVRPCCRTSRRSDQVVCPESGAEPYLVWVQGEAPDSPEAGPELLGHVMERFGARGGNAEVGDGVAHAGGGHAGGAAVGVTYGVTPPTRSGLGARVILDS
jgi:phosphoglycolate phosphatase-like HAD superfamily hydrolase